MALGPPRQKQRRAQQISIGGGEGDVIDENVVQRSLCHRDFPRSFCAAPANANSAFAARACLGQRKSFAKLVNRRPRQEVRKQRVRVKLYFQCRFSIGSAWSGFAPNGAGAISGTGGPASACV